MPTTAPGSLTPGGLRADRGVHPSAERHRRRHGGAAVGSRAPAEMTIPQGGFSIMAFSPYTPPAPKVTRPNPLDRYTPVTDAMLAAPAPSEWLGWRRTWDAHGFSPLTQINKEQCRATCAWRGAGRCRQGRMKACRWCTTACSSFTAWAIACRRSTRGPAICCGNTADSCRRASRPRSSAGWRSIAIVCTSGRPTPT